MTDALAIPLAHAGAGAGWQALLTVISIGVGVLFLLHLFGRLQLAEPGDLVVPLSAVAVISALSPVASDTLSDWVGYAVPAGAVALIALVLVTTSPMQLRGAPALIGGFLLVAVVASVAAGPALTRAWHPRTDPFDLPVAVDAAIEIVEPADGAELTAGTVRVVVAVAGGSVGPVAMTPEEAPNDLEELGQVSLFLDGIRRIDPIDQDRCTLERPCTTLTFEFEAEAGEHTIDAEFLAWNRFPFSPPVTDRIGFTAR